VTRLIQRWLARLLITGGAIVLMWVAAHLVLTMSNRRQYEATLERMRSSASVDASVAPASLPVGEPIGTLEIARVGLSGVVVEGDDDSVLDAAIGHLPDTPLPWHIGNSALAAHRDGLFRSLRGVRLGDVLRLKTRHGDFDYVVRDTMIVEPDELWVLDPTPVSMLTLISCYPFNFIGNAPKRFIVRAERMPRLLETSSRGGRVRHLPRRSRLFKKRQRAQPLNGYRSKVPRLLDEPAFDGVAS
jgi:sortase A